MAPHPDTDLDLERKNELIMEKRLRACRVNIIPRNRGYFSDSETYTPPAVNKRPQSPAPYPSAVKNARNPNALRYWHQCMGKASARQENEQTLNVESSQCPQKSYLSQDVKVVSTSGSEKSNGVSRAKEHHENLEVKHADVTSTLRSESVPRTIRTLKVTATITPSPVLSRKIFKSDVEGGKHLSSSKGNFSSPIGVNVENNGLGNTKRQFLSPILFQKNPPQASLSPDSVCNQVENKIGGTKKLTAPENVIKKEVAENILIAKNDIKNFERAGSCNRNLMSPLPFQSHISKANTPDLSKGSAKNGKFCPANGIVKGNEQPRTTRREFMSPIPFKSQQSAGNTPTLSPIPTLNQGIEINDAKHCNRNKGVTNNSSEKDAIGYRPGNLRTDLRSPIPFQGHAPDVNNKSKTLVTTLKEEETISENSRKNLMSPIPFQGKLKEARTASVPQNPVLHQKVNKQKVDDAKLLRDFETSFDKERVETVSFAQDRKIEYIPEFLRKSFVSPIPFPCRPSETNTPSRKQVPSLCQEIDNPDIELGNNSMKEFDRNGNQISVQSKISKPTTIITNKKDINELRWFNPSKNGFMDQVASSPSDAIEKVNGYDKNVNHMNSLSPISFTCNETATIAPSLNCGQKINNQDLEGVVETLSSFEDPLRKIPSAQKTQLGLELFNQLPENVVEDVLMKKLATMPSKQLGSMFSRIPEESVNKVIPTLFLKASDDVKLSLILDCLPKLSVQKIMKDLSDSEKETRKESLRKMTKSLMSHKQK